MNFVNIIFNKFKSKKILTLKFTGLFLILLTANLSFGMTLSVRDYVNHANNYFEQKAAGTKNAAPLLEIIDGFNAVPGPNALIIRTIGNKFLPAEQIMADPQQTRANLITALRRLITEIVELEASSIEPDDKDLGPERTSKGGEPEAASGGFGESKGGGSDGVSPDSSSSDASGAAPEIRFSDLVRKPKDDGPESFYLSLIPGIRSLTLGFAGIAPRAPIIGFYDPAGYKVREPLMVVEGTVDLLKHVSPDLYSHVNDIGADKMKFYIDIWGPFMGVDLPANSPNNVVFHEIVALWTDQRRPHININGGLFKPDGVNVAVSSPISVNNLSAIDVNYHDDHWSPNNARFRLVDGRNIASFWLVGKHAGHAVVTLNLIINSASNALGAKLIADIQRSNTLADLIHGFNGSAVRPSKVERTTRPIPATREAEDAQAVWNFTDFLETMLTV